MFARKSEGMSANCLGKGCYTEEEEDGESRVDKENRKDEMNEGEKYCSKQQ